MGPKEAGINKALAGSAAWSRAEASENLCEKLCGTSWVTSFVKRKGYSRVTTQRKRRTEKPALADFFVLYKLVGSAPVLFFLVIR